MYTTATIFICMTIINTLSAAKPNHGTLAKDRLTWTWPLGPMVPDSKRALWVLTHRLWVKKKQTRKCKSNLALSRFRESCTDHHSTSRVSFHITEWVGEKEALAESGQGFWTSQSSSLSTGFQKVSIRLLNNECLVITEPAVTSARLLGLGSKLYPSNMQRMLNKDFTGFMQSLFRVHQNRASERKAPLAGCQRVRFIRHRPDNPMYLTRSGYQCKVAAYGWAFVCIVTMRLSSLQFSYWNQTFMTTHNDAGYGVSRSTSFKGRW